MIKVLYIAGYGRSGSTILGTLLGTGKRFIHVGEIAFLAQEWPRHLGRCSCGEQYAACVFWGQALTPAEAHSLATTASNVERFGHLSALIRNKIGHSTRTVYALGQRRLFRYALEKSCASIVVDGSKSAWATAGRPLALKKIAGCDIYVLHLVRSARSTLRSVSKVPTNREFNGRAGPVRLRMLRTVAGWVTANLVAYLIGRWGIGRRRYMRVRYTELLRDPNGILGRIARFVDEDLEDALGRVAGNEFLPVGHVVGGSRIRFDGPLKLHRQDPTAPSDTAEPALASVGSTHS